MRIWPTAGCTTPPVPTQPSSQHFWLLRVPQGASKGLHLVTFLPAQCDPGQDPSLGKVLFSTSYVWSLPAWLTVHSSATAGRFLLFPPWLKDVNAAQTLSPAKRGKKSQVGWPESLRACVTSWTTQNEWTQRAWDTGSHLPKQEACSLRKKQDGAAALEACVANSALIWRGLYLSVKPHCCLCGEAGRHLWKLPESPR